MRKPLVIITGPTAVGKTELSIELAKKINGEIISADSIQVYRHMNIGSAKVTVDEMQGIRHYLIDELDPKEDFSVAVFKEKAKHYIEEIHEKGKIPIIAGGTGFYIQSVLYDIQFEDVEADESYRKELEEFVNHNGPKALHEMLGKVDEKAADAIHFNNVKRVIRALEYNKLTGQKISEHNELQRQNTSPYNFVYFVLNDDRDRIYERINQRVDKMIGDGLEDEVKSLLDSGYDESLVSMQGIGYKEMVRKIKGEIDDRQAIEEIKINTRHFAKRQLTWFRREKDVTMIEYPEFGYDKSLILDAMLIKLKNQGIV